MGDGMETAYQVIPDILRELNLSDFVTEDYDDGMDHGELVKRMVVLLGRQMGLEEPLLEQAARAAIVHDIGKLQLSRYLYGRDKQALHVEEVRYMRTHARLGRDMLSECGYPQEILDAVYHHHENYDGSGYPDNLAGERIPLLARLLRVCDAFAALASNRPYREAFDWDTAVELMIEDVKTFDMRIFLEFLKLYHSEEFEAVKDFSRQINARQRYVAEKPA